MLLIQMTNHAQQDALHPTQMGCHPPRRDLPTDSPTANHSSHHHHRRRRRRHQTHVAHYHHLQVALPPSECHRHPPTCQISKTLRCPSPCGAPSGAPSGARPTWWSPLAGAQTRPHCDWHPTREARGYHGHGTQAVVHLPGHGFEAPRPPFHPSSTAGCCLRPEWWPTRPPPFAVGCGETPTFRHRHSNQTRWVHALLWCHQTRLRSRRRNDAAGGVTSHRLSRGACSQA